MVGEPIKHPEGYWTSVDPFPCEDWCAQDGQFVQRWREDRNCTRLDFRGKWTGKEFRTVHLGAPKRYDLMALSFEEIEKRTGLIGFDPFRPPEAPSDGCPKGWVLCRFIASIAPFYRRRIGDSRVDSIRQRPDDPLLEECLRIAEAEEQAARNRFDAERFKAKA
jgi:hypothetical protein